jgi:large repetitive protein
MQLFKEKVLNVLIVLIVVLLVYCLPVQATLPEFNLNGYVREANQSTAIENAIVLISCGSIHRMAVTNILGYYQIQCIDYGDYSVMVFDENGIPILAESDIAEVHTVWSGKTIYAEGGAISGTVKNSSNSPISGAEIKVIRTDADSMFYTTNTNGSGGYLVSRLPAGDYIVSAKGYSYGLGIKDDVTVYEDSTTSNQDIVLQSAGSITGTVETTTNQLVSGANVFAMRTDGDDADILFGLERTTTAGNGTYTIDWLPTGTYVVLVTDTSYVSDSTADISVVSGQTTSGIDFSLATQGGAITGTVTDGSTPIEGAIVTCYCEGKSCALSETNSNGTYSLNGLIADTYYVFVAAASDTECLYDYTTAVVTGTQTTSGVNFNF